MIGVAALISAVVVPRLPSPTTVPAASPTDRVRVVSSLAQAPRSVQRVDPPPVSSAWTGPERGAILAALHLSTRARLDDVTGTEVPRQVLCGRVQVSSDQPFRRFAYVKTAKLGTIDDGGAEFAQAFAQLCGQ
ncbi:MULTISPECIES: hypothetical protein [unclassified Sphingomonas]|uniref:hypothetical protein n=1 Tax=unclassified Sphingomonas TaxID=196159 RepID=UPI000F74B388|nr:hypothetical protein [Sphingomonas sp. FARSPH]